MEGIKRLPKSVHNSMRSSVILCDLPRVVEELVYNSVDAAASKVFISIGIRACYIKVEDDGIGITRDGFVILGERNATSKLRLLSESETTTESLGFRGEALGCLSDVSLVEIRSKARGKPTAYCKILKGSKCLFLGIDDKREGFGTTVTVRDLFYNQPVRRKYIHSSPKRVLHAVKKCVLRTALVYPQVSFTVTDIESEDEVLATIPSSSPLPLPLVSDGFGNEVSSSLHEINFSDKILTLCGYISGPAEVFSTKAFQYIYINSRFVCKGPIHNLLNNLAVSFQCPQPQRQLEPEFHISKRQRILGYPAYILNLCCPLSSYDLNFEPSKTVVEFKDWDLVLSFFDQAIRRFWKQLVAEPLEGTASVQEDFVHMKCEQRKEDNFRISEAGKMCNIQFDPYSHRSIASHLDTFLEDNNVYRKPFKDQFHYSSKLKPCQAETSCFGQTDNNFRDVNEDSQNVGYFNHEELHSANSDPHQLIANVDFSVPENVFSPDNVVKVKGKYDFPDMVWKSSPEEVRNLTAGLSRNTVASRTNDIADDVEEERYIFDYTTDLSGLGTDDCFLRENMLDSPTHCSDCSSFSFPFDHLGKDYNVGAPVDTVGSTLNLSSRASLKKNGDSSLGFLRKCQANRQIDVLPTDAFDAFPCENTCLSEEKKMHNELGAQVWENSSCCESPDKGWLLESPLLLSTKSSKNAHDFTHTFTLEENTSYFRSASCESSSTLEEAKSLNYVQQSFDESYSTRSCTGTRSLKRHLYYDYSPDKISFADGTSFSKFDDGIDWWLSDSSDMKNTDSYVPSEFHSCYIKQELQNRESSLFRKVRSRRSHSAPPFFKGKRKFSILNDHLAENDPISNSTKSVKMAEDNICLSNDQLAHHVSQSCLDPLVGEDPESYFREYIDGSSSTHKTNDIQNGLDDAYSDQLPRTSSVEDTTTEEVKYAAAALTKWRTGLPQTTVEDKVQTYPEHEDDILDISSGILHLSSGSLIPESINKDFLDGARVLLQLDRKFIPVISGGTLAVIDQHAADERIRLEELRQKVLSGEGISVTYLDSEQKLVLPEMGFQLLQKYEKQIQKWGWICNTHNQSSSSSEKNMKLLKRRTCGATIVAVPCILGINLTTEDLVEYIEQLVETDGSSTLPPSVLRTLNFKSCRGAIMFGDPLLRSECSLILEELKATSLCFQCAHGRPTTVPLINISALREQLARLEMQKGELMETWHGFRRHRPNLERAQVRLDSAKRFCSG